MNTIICLQDLKDINTILKQVFLLLPHYCLGRGLIDMASLQLRADVTARLGQCPLCQHPGAYPAPGCYSRLTVDDGVAVIMVITTMRLQHPGSGSDYSSITVDDQ